jgi:phage terminase large subunit-like protein
VVVECESFIITPEKGKKIDYDEKLKPILEAVFMRYRVRVVAYDEYQLHHFMTELAKQYSKIEFYAFPQNNERVLADTAFKNRLEEGRFRHSGNGQTRQHIQNARRKVVKDDGRSIRIVKASAGKPIDWDVAASMASWKLENVPNPKGTITRARIKGGFYRSSR